MEVSNSVQSESIRIRVQAESLLADLHTPVSLYLRLRDRFPQSLLLESSDYHSREDSYSFICLEPVAGFIVEQGEILETRPGQAGQPAQLRRSPFPDMKDVGPAPGYENGSDPPAHVSPLIRRFQAFLQEFTFSGTPEATQFNGFFGHTAFDSIRHFDSHQLDPEKHHRHLPDFRYQLFRFVIVIHHFTEEMRLIENIPDGQTSGLDALKSMIRQSNFGAYPFERVGGETSNISDHAFRDLVVAGKQHCQLGDVFQVVFSRELRQVFKGDEFNVYRALRAINPSPYLFFFDYGDYKIFGSSPEAQLVVKEGKAQIHPIAGTYRRTGDDVADHEAALKLKVDPKENSEHVMLVDLARNDLSRHCQQVSVERLMDIQFFSHVIHLTSLVEGRVKREANTVDEPIKVDAALTADSQGSAIIESGDSKQSGPAITDPQAPIPATTAFQPDPSALPIFADTFPAGTLSGAPKYRALQLINQYENQNRGFYGGAIGYFGLKGELNQAITIRSFYSRNNVLHYQAGAGIVVDSDPETELQETNHKLAALKKALEMAERMEA